MKTAVELYAVSEEWSQKEEGDFFYGPSDYMPMLNEFGRIVVLMSENGYSGDTWVFYCTGNEEGKFGKSGYLQVGWGSCSGCDALQGCDSKDDVQKLMNELYSQIIWFDEEDDAITYFKEHDWEGDYSGGNKTRDLFIQAVILYNTRW